MKVEWSLLSKGFSELALLMVVSAPRSEWAADRGSSRKPLLETQAPFALHSESMHGSTSGLDRVLDSMN